MPTATSSRFLDGIAAYDCLHIEQRDFFIFAACCQGVYPAHQMLHQLTIDFYLGDCAVGAPFVMPKRNLSKGIVLYVINPSFLSFTQNAPPAPLPPRRGRAPVRVESPSNVNQYIFSAM